MSLKDDIERIKREKSNPEQTKSAKDCGLKDLEVEDCIDWEDTSNNPEVELENKYEVYKDEDGILQLKKRK